jgi:hypothetical protein
MKKIGLVFMLLGFFVIASCDSSDNSNNNKIKVDGNVISINNNYKRVHEPNCWDGGILEHPCETHRQFGLAFTDGYVDEDGLFQDNSYYLLLTVASTDLDKIKPGTYEATNGSVWNNQSSDLIDKLVAIIQYTDDQQYAIGIADGTIIVSGTVDKLTIKIDATFTVNRDNGSGGYTPVSIKVTGTFIGDFSEDTYIS